MPGKWGGCAPKCGRCGISVYKAEERIGAGKSWHTSCFTCKLCNKSLESTTLAEHRDVTDPDSVEIYCKTCYGKNFGPKGYGYGAGAGTLSMDRGDKGWAKDNAPKHFDPKVSKGIKGQGVCCPRCNFAVYTAEEVLACNQSWHKACFKCNECMKSLDSTNVHDKNGEVYCKICYGKLYGPKGYGYGQGGGTLTITG